MSLAPFLSYLRLTLAEVRAARLVWAVPVYGLLLVLASALPSPDAEGRARLLLELSVALSFGLLGLVVATFASLTLAREFTQGIELTLVTKPAGAWARATGKLFGLLLATLVLVVLNAGLGYVCVRWAAADAAGAPAFLAPTRYQSARTGVFRNTADRRPRPLVDREPFAPTDPSRPAWFFDEAPQEGAAEIVVQADVRLFSHASREGALVVAARRGTGEVQTERVTLFSSRPHRLRVDPPGRGTLSVVLHPTGTTLLYPHAHSVRLAEGQGSFALAYALSHLGVFFALAVVAALGLFFSSSCRPRAALAFTLVLTLASTSVASIRTFARALEDGPAAVGRMQQSFSELLPGASEHEHQGSAPPASSGGRWAGLRLLMSATAAVLPDLARYDRRETLRSGVLAEPGLLLRDAGAAAGTTLLLGCGVLLGLLATGREGRR